jgi:hypothetical protein
MTPTDGVETQTRMRALRCLLRNYEPGRTPFRRIDPALADDLLRYAATLSDEKILDMRGVGPALLRWIRANQPDRFDGPSCGVDGCEREVGHIGDHRPLRTNDYRAVRSDSQAGSTFALVLQQKNWHVELFWNGSAGWFTARLVSLRDRDGRRDYPGGYLVPFDDPIGASGATPEEALASLSEAVLEWA